MSRRRSSARSRCSRCAVSRRRPTAGTGPPADSQARRQRPRAPREGFVVLRGACRGTRPRVHGRVCPAGRARARVAPAAGRNSVRAAGSPETVLVPQRNPEQETVVLRKVAAAILAVPVLAILYLPVIARRSIAARLALLGSVGIVVAVAAISLARPAPTTATPPSPPIRAVPAEAFRSISTGLDLHAAVPIEFSEPMDPTSVAAALKVEPPTAVELRWSADHR